MIKHLNAISATSYNKAMSIATTNNYNSSTIFVYALMYSLFLLLFISFLVYLCIEEPQNLRDGLSKNILISSLIMVVYIILYALYNKDMSQLNYQKNLFETFIGSQKRELLYKYSKRLYSNENAQNAISLNNYQFMEAVYNKYLTYIAKNDHINFLEFIDIFRERSNVVIDIMDQNIST